MLLSFYRGQKSEDIACSKLIVHSSDHIKEKEGAVATFTPRVTWSISTFCKGVHILIK